jgi:hypothetical protein
MIGKLISKILANRLALRLGSLVHSSQSAFVNGRSIHDSFWSVQALARQLFVNKKPSILFKADILKAFDSVAWSFLMEILGHLGFSNVWFNWGTKVLLNGALGSWIRHGQGLRQEDLLSPMLFIFMMDVLNAMFHKGEEWSLLQQLGVRGISHRVSLYTDDVILFLSPSAADMEMVHIIFSIFEGALGLKCNLSKCQIVPIRCEPAHLELATSFFSCTVAEFPVRYIGIPLSVTTLPKIA